MPGVPSGKGCKSCRKQKKKCDQKKPSCSRCARLGVPCIGAGQQRYTFKSVHFDDSNGVERPLKQIIISHKTILPRSPQNELAVTASMFVAALEMSDLRFSLGCYGDFLKHIPKRLGQSDALDASVKALVAAFPFHHTGQLQPEALAHYIDALKALRLCLNYGDGKLCAETICAIYFVMICQGWFGRSDDHVRSHGEILAHLTSSAIVQKWRGDFELSLLETLFVPVILEAMVNPIISLESWSISLLEPYLPSKMDDKTSALHVPSMEIQKLVRMPEFFRSPEPRLSEIRSAYQELSADRPRIRRHLDELARNDVGYASDARVAHKLQVVHAVLLTVVTALNSLLRTLDPTNTRLLEDVNVFLDDMVVLAMQASKYRPLGASFVPPCLAAVWATTDGLSRQVDLERLMLEYQPDFPHIKWMDQAVWLNSMHRLLLQQLKGSPDSPLTDIDLTRLSQSLSISMVHCKASFGASGSCLFR